MASLKIDLYSRDDPWNSSSWSGTTFELATALKNLEALGNAYEVEIKRNSDMFWSLLNFLSYHRLYKKKIYFIKANHPRYVKALWKLSMQIFQSNPKPDAIITIGDIAPFADTPYFVYQDLDIATILNWRAKGRKTYMFDCIPASILKIRQELQEAVYSKAEGIMVASSWLSKSISTYIDDPKKIYVTGMGHGYKPTFPGETLIEKRFEKPIILFVGKDGYRKGLDLVLSAFEILKEEIPRAEFKVVTNFDALPRELKGRLKHCPGVTTSSNLASLEVQELYATSTIFVMPSRFEPWGKVFFEAMAYGLPVIGARCCAMPEFIIDGYNGYTIELDHYLLVDKLSCLLESSKKYREMSTNAVKVSEKFMWNNVSKGMLDIAEAALGHS